MPVIVIGADDPTGDAVLTALRGRAGEVRGFVSDRNTGDRLRATEVKVAIGDLSDASHIEAACTNSFCAVLVTAAADDGRELAFAGPEETIRGWAAAIAAAGVTRALWVTDDVQAASEFKDATPQSRLIDVRGRSPEEVATVVADLDDADRI